MGDQGVLREGLALLHHFHEELFAKAQLPPGRLQQGIAQPIGSCRKKVSLAMWRPQVAGANGLQSSILTSHQWKLNLTGSR